MQPITIQLNERIELDDLILFRESQKLSLGWLISKAMFTKGLNLEDFYYLGDYCGYCEDWSKYQWEFYKKMGV